MFSECLYLIVFVQPSLCNCTLLDEWILLMLNIGLQILPYLKSKVLKLLPDYTKQRVSHSCGFQDGVLTVQFGVPYGTYVINRQVPNLQIWLSSPISGPKRYDFHDGCWTYRHDGVSLHELLNQEIPDIVNQDVDFFRCAYSGKSKQDCCVL